MLEFILVKREDCLMQTRVCEEPLSEGMIQQYSETHGEERALGYVDAMRDFLMEIEDIIVKTRFENGRASRENSIPMIIRNLKIYTKEQRKLLETPLLQEMLKEVDQEQPVSNTPNLFKYGLR